MHPSHDCYAVSPEKTHRGGATVPLRMHNGDRYASRIDSCIAEKFRLVRKMANIAERGRNKGWVDIHAAMRSNI